MSVFEALTRFVDHSVRLYEREYVEWFTVIHGISDGINYGKEGKPGTIKFALRLLLKCHPNSYDFEDADIGSTEVYAINPLRMISLLGVTRSDLRRSFSNQINTLADTGYSGWVLVLHCPHELVAFIESHRDALEHRTCEAFGKSVIEVRLQRRLEITTPSLEERIVEYCRLPRLEAAIRHKFRRNRMELDSALQSLRSCRRLTLHQNERKKMLVATSFADERSAENFKDPREGDT